MKRVAPVAQALAELYRAHPALYAFVAVGTIWLAGALLSELAVRLIDRLAGGRRR